MASTTAGTSDEGFEALLEYILRVRGFDFTGYKRPSLSRRIQRRMRLVGAASFAEYIDHLEVHPDEFPQLFNTVLINVTGFFRDEPAWRAVAYHVEKLLSSRPANSSLRVWSAGCASGQEPYSLAMMFGELLGVEATTRRVKIYATDVDDGALAEARAAVYPPREVEELPPELLNKYFSRSGSGFCLGKELRRAVIFGRHDLVQDAPISRVDLLLCRNTLMYFNAETQSRILGKLHFALSDDGILFLGKAEMLLTHASLFSPIDLKLRLFSRVPRARADRGLPLVAAGDPPPVDVDSPLFGALQGAALEGTPLAILVLDAKGRVAFVNHRASSLFGIGADAMGRPFSDLELSYKPAELRSVVDRVLREDRAVAMSNVERVLPGGEKTYLDIQVAPLHAAGSAEQIGVELSFSDGTRAQQLQQELSQVSLALEAAHEELQSTSEELETANEQLQSTNEELETTNEELQSTNEELETMNEELQSTNEELQTMNVELRDRTEQLNQANTFLATILASLNRGVAVLDRELVVRAWNTEMCDLWGLRTEEVVGKHFLSLDIGMPMDSLRSSIRGCVTSGAATNQELDCTNRRGKAIRCRVVINPLQGTTPGVILLVEEAP